MRLWYVPVWVLLGAPGLLAVVWAGASLEGAFRVERLAVRPELVAASLAMGALALVASRWVRRRSSELP